MNTSMSTSNRSELILSKKNSRTVMRRMAVTTSLLFLTLSGVSSVWAGDRQTAHAAPLHLAGFSIHIGPGGGIHFGVGGHRHGFRGHYGHPRKHFGHRHYFKRSKPFYGHRYRHFPGPRNYGKHFKHRHYFKGGRHFRRHRH